LSLERFEKPDRSAAAARQTIGTIIDVMEVTTTGRLPDYERSVGDQAAQPLLMATNAEN
jgi:hypothetical protein